MSTRSDLDALLDKALLNPMAVQKAGMEHLEKVRNGEVEIVDASNAFSYLTEMASTMFVNALRKGEINGQRQYPELAMSRLDLYHHMSNVDYIDTFAIPAETDIVFAFNMEELISRAVPTGDAGVKKIVIPRNTQIMAGTVPFTMQYPIEIRVLSHGGLQVVYDNSRPSPMQALETNEVTNQPENYNADHVEYLQITVPTYQMAVKSYTTPLSAAKIFSKAYPYTDQFYHCRVYQSTTAGGWEEINTTHSDQVFNPLVPTALLRVLDGNQLNVSIPQIYYSTGLVNRELRIDIFTTKGAMELNVNTYAASMFIPTWTDLDKDDNGKYTSPIKQMVDGFIVATKPANGGANMLSFEKLKERVIHNALGPIDLPITNVQIQSQLDRLTDSGFSCVTVKDNVTKRLYLATRELPAPSIAEVSTGIGSNVVTLMKTTNEILTSADVVDNGTRVTMLPTTLYRNEGGFLSIVSAEERDALLALEGDQRVEAVTGGRYLYTPFHYVYDFTDSVFTVRPYYFNNPDITRRFFVANNGTLNVGVSSSSHDFTRTATGWRLRVMTSSTDSLKELDDDSVVAQLAFVPVGELGRVYLNGELVGRDPKTKEWLFEFNFDTTWDVDSADSIYLKGFVADGISPHPYAASLSTVFSIYYGVDSASVETTEPSKVDLTMGHFMFERPVVGLYQEEITCTLGSELSGLWVQARSTIGEESYLKYEEDIPKRWTSDQPKRDPETQAIVTERDADGNLRVVYEYRAGDIVMKDGVIEYAHRIGQTVMQDGLPIVISPRTILRQVELCLFDGVYYFATAQTDADYRESVPLQIIEWVNTTLVPVRKKVLEQTDLLFHPKATIGRVKAIVDGSQIMTMEAAQSFAITYYVTEKVQQDEALKTEIRNTTRRQITARLKEALVTQDNLESVLKAIGGDDVIAVDVEGLGGVMNYRVVSMADDSSRCVIGRKLVALPNKTYSVEDNIDIIFKKHAIA